MNKKVLSAILFSALFAGTGTFTSCIDNDEPAGIEELRGAKAELLRAKVAVEQAEASLRLAQAEVEKAKAAKQLADAEISKAIAAINQAKADSINVATEKERAELEKIIAENKIHLDSMQVIGQIAMNKLNESLAQSQRSYEIMLAQIEIAKATASEKDYVTVSELQAAVRRAQRGVNRATEDVAKAQKDVDYWTAFDEAYKDLYKTRLEAGVTEAEAGLESAKEKLAKWEGFYENSESADWLAEVASLNDTLEAIKKDTLDLRIEVTKIKESAEYQALKKDTITAVAYVDSVYGYKYYDAYKGELKEFAKTLKYKSNNGGKYTGAELVESDVDSLDAIKAELKSAISAIKAQKTTDSTEVLSYTAYKKDLLDTIAAHAIDTMLNFNSNKEIKAWETALAAYKAGKDVEVASIATDAATFITAMTTPASGQTEVTVVAKKAAVAAFATNLAAVYNALPASQVTYNVMKLQKPSYPATGTTTDDKKITEVLADATNQYHYMVYVLQYFGLAEDVDFNSGTGILDFKLSANGEIAANYETCFTKTGVAATTTPAANAKSVLLALKGRKAGTLAGNFTVDSDQNQIGATLYGDLVIASAKAFGASSLYLNAKENDVNNQLVKDNDYYLTVKPDTADIHYVFNTIMQSNKDSYEKTIGEGSDKVTLTYSYGALGAFGTSLTTQVDSVKTFAMNYKAYLANLEGAVAYWEASLEKLEKKVTDNTLANLAAVEALNAYYLENVQPLEDKISILDDRAESVGEIVEALNLAIELYLPNHETGDKLACLDGLKVYIDGEIKEAKGALKTAEDTLADAKLELALFEQGKYNPSADAQAELDEAIAKLEKATAKLETALANLAKGLEIIAAVNGAEDAE